jgi:nanoRNase/pAp phosphatase (c-di-AMP/oligoRNAs hydrolase)
MITDLTRQRYAAFAELVRQRGRGRWLVLTHDNPDPDALASAALLARLLRFVFKHRVTTAYGGLIGRAENREMVKSLGLSFSHVRHLSFKNYSHFALVDTQPRTGNNQLPEAIEPDVVIDHHPLRKATQATPFFDVRPQYGATVSILAEYLLASAIPPGPETATTLVYAIRSETQEFGREASGPDKALYDAFFPQANKRLLSKIQHATLPLDYFRILHQALESLETVSTLIVSHLGAVDQPDIVPEIADLLLRMEHKTWSLCTGVYNDRVYLSIRTTNPRADAGRLMRRLVGRRGKGGGHGTLAGGWVPLDKAPGGDPRAVQRRLAARLARALKKNPEKLLPIDLQAAARPKAAEAAARSGVTEAAPRPAPPEPTGAASGRNGEGGGAK